eukprot:TRINITY_DN13659_c0_g3_i1.p1 TRINITY_DN13659_c0_g3~~TRINITY_DN13659_c0_g3_i1.p1  ORF type:complete len:305 (+),score=108.04 TRINITY_DN13659_c0_g3_i1:708-1622(+)
MAEELRLQVQETDDLQRTKKQMEEENKRLLREVELNQKSVEEYAKQGYKYSKELRSKTEEIKNLENSLSKVVHNFEEEREDRVRNHRRELKENKTEIEGLRKLLQIRTYELNALRKLSKLILNERSQTERFFLESLDTVRKEIGSNNSTQSKHIKKGQQQFSSALSKQSGIGKGRRRQQQDDEDDDADSINDAMSEHSFRSETSNRSRISIRSEGSQLSIVSGNRSKRSNQMDDDAQSVRSTLSKKSEAEIEKADISELSWEDKEKVLRILFAKINAASYDPQDYEGEGWWLEDESESEYGEYQ